MPNNDDEQMSLRSDKKEFKLDVNRQANLELPKDQKLCGFMNGVWQNISFNQWQITVGKYFYSRKDIKQSEKVAIALANIDYNKGNAGLAVTEVTFAFGNCCW